LDSYYHFLWWFTPLLGLLFAGVLVGVGVSGSQVSGEAMATSLFAWHVRSAISLHVRVGMLSMVPFKSCEVSSSGRMSASATASAAGDGDHRERLARTCV